MWQLSTNEYLKFGLICSLLASVGLVYQILGWISMNIIIFVTFISSYPVTKLLTAETGRSWLDLGFILVVLPLTGSILAFSSVYPIGFGDVHAHIEATIISVESGHLKPLSRPTFNFVGLYILANTLKLLLNLNLTTVAIYLPLISFTTTALVFYRFIDGESNYRGIPLIATFIFIFSWGVFRFTIEYRTLDIAFLYVVAVLGILLKYRTGTQKFRRDSILLMVFGSVLAISHFTTFLFFIALISALYISSIFQGDSHHRIYPIVLSVLTLFVYVIYFGDGSIYTITRLLFNQYYSIVSDTTVSTGRTQGLVGLTYGYNLFLIRWILRIGFVISFISIALYHRDTKQSWLNFEFVAAGLLGMILLFSATIGFGLSPSRVLTFFAIPFAIVYSEGIRIARTEYISYTSIPKSVVSILLVCMMILILTLVPTASIMKFPSDIIGETEPIRGHEPIDEISYYEIDSYDVESREFLSKYGTEHQSIEIQYGPQSETVREFYLSTLPPRIFSNPNGEIKYTITNERRLPQRHRIYNSGGVYIQSQNEQSENQRVPKSRPDSETKRYASV